MVINPAPITPAWKTSVHTTARIPPWIIQSKTITTRSPTCVNSTSTNNQLNKQVIPPYPTHKNVCKCYGHILKVMVKIITCQN